MNFKEWKQRNLRYYENNFELLEKGEKESFNWAAFFGGPAYWAYRKMYGMALALIIFNHVCIVLLLIVGKGPERFIGLFELGISLGVLFFYIWLASRANAMYYSFVKKQVEKGYSGLEKFSPTAGLLFWLVYIDNRVTLLAVIGICAYAIADYRANPFIKKTNNRKKFEVTAKQIKRYLRGTEEDSDYVEKIRQGIYILFVISVLLVLIRPGLRFF